MAEESYIFTVRKIAVSKGIIIPEHLSEVQNSSESATHLVFHTNVDSEVKKVVTKSITDLKFTKLAVKIIDLNPNGGKIIII